MSDWLDLMGSFIIGGVVMLMLASFNTTVSTSASQNLFEGVTQRQIVSSSSAMEEDLYKAGFKEPGEKIAVADSNEIKFFGDLGNNGSMDTVRYSLGNTAELAGTSNPDDRYLYRTLNSDVPQPLHVVTSFYLSYFDSLGQQINYTDLTNSAGRARIKTIRMKLIQESSEPIDNQYSMAEFEKTIRPKNL
jgi:hypothetical protein